MKASLTFLLLLTFAVKTNCYAQNKSVIDSAAIVYGNNSSAGHYASINGIQLYYESYGKGQPLIMLHGNGGAIDAFKFQIPFFEKHFHVIAIDSRLQGKSGGSADSLSYDLMADDFCKLLDYLKIDSAFVLGWSDGGINAIIMAMHCPEHIKGIAFTGANIVPDTSAFNPAMIQEMKDFVKRKDISPVERTLNVMMINEPNIPYKELGKIKCPALVMAGDHDLIRPEHTIKIYQSLQNAELCIFPDSEHGVCLQHPEMFNETVMRFFRKYSSE
ncbi:MAG: alpha/beta hydrolase [Chitinophagaceae bacterium]|nr:alpha/beta hydrolase [Chitinophagaceae bacterium]